MRRAIDSVQNTLAYQLQGLLDAESRIKKELYVCTEEVTSTELKAEIQQYFEEADDKLQKLDRIFSYLMQQPIRRTNELDAATDLVQEILEWEMATSRNLATLSTHEFNKVNSGAKTE